MIDDDDDDVGDDNKKDATEEDAEDSTHKPVNTSDNSASSQPREIIFEIEDN